MRKEELIKQLQEREPLLANAVSHMVEYIQDRYPAAYPSKEQTEAVNDYLQSVHADGDGSMSERNCEHRRIASTEHHHCRHMCVGQSTTGQVAKRT